MMAGPPFSPAGTTQRGGRHGWPTLREVVPNDVAGTGPMPAATPAEVSRRRRLEEARPGLSLNLREVSSEPVGVTPVVFCRAPVEASLAAIATPRCRGRPCGCPRTMGAGGELVWCELIVAEAESRRGFRDDHVSGVGGISGPCRSWPEAARGLDPLARRRCTCAPRRGGCRRRGRAAWDLARGAEVGRRPYHSNAKPRCGAELGQGIRSAWPDSFTVVSGQTIRRCVAFRKMGSDKDRPAADRRNPPRTTARPWPTALHRPGGSGRSFVAIIGAAGSGLTPAG